VGHAVGSWLRHYATSRKVAGSGPMRWILFNGPKSSNRTMALESTLPLTYISTRDLLEVKSAADA
jgi:hypothetical protein